MNHFSWFHRDLVMLWVQTHVRALSRKFNYKLSDTKCRNFISIELCSSFSESMNLWARFSLPFDNSLVSHFFPSFFVRGIIWEILRNPGIDVCDMYWRKGIVPKRNNNNDHECQVEFKMLKWRKSRKKFARTKNSDRKNYMVM